MSFNSKRNFLRPCPPFDNSNHLEDWKWTTSWRLVRTTLFLYFIVFWIFEYSLKVFGRKFVKKIEFDSQRDDKKFRFDINKMKVQFLMDWRCSFDKNVFEKDLGGNLDRICFVDGQLLSTLDKYVGLGSLLKLDQTGTWLCGFKIFQWRYLRLKLKCNFWFYTFNRDREDRVTIVISSDYLQSWHCWSSALIVLASERM